MTPLSGEGPLADRLALAFLAGYKPSTRSAYARDLRDFYRWCADHGVDVLAVTRAHADAYARELDEVRHLAPTTLARRLSAVAGLYAYAVAEGVLDRSPLAHVKRPKVADDSQSTGLDRDEASSLLAAAQASGPRDHALVALLLFNGLRVSEVVTANVEHLDHERGHRVLRIVRKGGKRATVPLAPRVADALDTYLGDRSGGALFLSVRSRAPLDRTAIWRIVRKLAATAVPAKASTLHPHDLRHAFVTLSSRQRGQPARRAGRGRTCRPPHHPPLRPGAPQPRPAPDLHPLRPHRVSRGE